MDCLLLGQDHDTYGEVVTIAVSERSAASISVGADQSSPSLRFKGHGDVPNEDALCVVDTGELIFMAVADAHFGHESSHALINRLHAAVNAAMPTGRGALMQTMAGLGNGPDSETGSESTLLTVLFSRTTGQGFAVSFGDSTLAVVTAAGQCQPLNVKDGRYVAAADRWPVGDCSVSTFRADPGDLLLLFTDGIDECHYRQPATSVRFEHVGEVVREASGSPKRVAEQLARLALAGVDGHPGGQDNIAIIAALA